MTVRKGIFRLGKHRKDPDFGTKYPEAAGSVPRRRRNGAESLFGENGPLYRMTPAQRKHTRRKLIRWLLILLCAVIVMAFAALVILNSPYGTKQFLQYCTYLL